MLINFNKFQNKFKKKNFNFNANRQISQIFNFFYEMNKNKKDY